MPCGPPGAPGRCPMGGAWTWCWYQVGAPGGGGGMPGWAAAPGGAPGMPGCGCPWYQDGAPGGACPMPRRCCCGAFGFWPAPSGCVGLYHPPGWPAAACG